MRKNTLLIFVAILLVGGSFVFAEYRNKKEKSIYSASENKNNVTTSASDTIDSSAKNIDTDGDGSRDWEEILAGTNPNDPKSKPSATKTSTTKDLTKNTAEKLEPIALISREFFARYLELRQIGAENDKASQEDLAQRTVNGIVLSKPIDYKISDILTKPDDSKDAVKLYGDQVSSIFKKYSINSRNEGQIAQEAGEKEDPSILKEIDPIIESYKNITNSLLKLVIPKSMATMHLDLVNAMNGSLFIAKSFRNSSVNPIESIQGIAYYQVVAKNLFDAVNAIKSYFKYLGLYENIF